MSTYMKTSLYCVHVAFTFKHNLIPSLSSMAEKQMTEAN